MRRKLLLLAVLLLIFSSFVQAQIIVGGAGAASVNGTYTNTFGYEGKPAYEIGGGGFDHDILWRSDLGEWRITNGGGNGRFYYNTADTPTPPSGGWQVGTEAAPVPTMTGSVTLTAPAGSGTSGDPYLITTLADLYWMTQTSGSWDKVFKQTADIDASSTSAWASGAGFTPIGDAYGTSFTGSYDGQNHTITGLLSNRSSTNYLAFFGAASSGTITNLFLANPNISGRQAVGGLIAYDLNETVENCAVIGGNVGGSDGTAGGLIGYQYNGTTSKCFSSASVSTGSFSGGLIGQFRGGSAVCTNCYSTGSVWGADALNGGFIALVDDGTTISNCYSTGATTGGGSAGGFIGARGTATVNNCFWDMVSSGLATGVHDGSSSGVTGKNTAQMKSNLIFLSAGWSPAVWNRDDGTNNGYPYLKWQNPGGTALSSPIPASNVALWLRADKGATGSGSSISNWADQSGNGNDATQAVADNMPLVGTAMNGQATINFNPSSHVQFLNLPAASTLGIQNSPYEMFIVARTSSGATQFLISGALYEQYEYHIATSTGVRFIPTTGIYIDQNTSTLSDGNPHVLAARASSSGGTVRFDGVDGGSSLLDVRSADAGGLYIGIRQGVTFPFSGDIAEVILYNTNLSPADRYTAEHYLAERYGITSGLLPVELSSFSVAPSADGAILQWKTATEVNNSGFAVERRSSLSGWTELGFVKGAGTSTSPKEYSYKDTKISGGSYVYRLKQIDNGGAFKYSAEATVTIDVPHVFALDQNYPNPFNPTTAISFTLAEDSHVSLKVFDVVGHEVATLVDQNLKAGELHSVMFNASNLSSGVYFYQLQAGKNSMVKKLLLAK